MKVTATAAATTPAPASTDTTTTTAKKTFATLFADAKDDLKKGEKLTKVSGHQFGRIQGGTRDDMCVNLSGNARTGQAFDLIWRDGRQFHVYGEGKDKVVVEVGRKQAAADDTAAAKTTETTTTAAASTGGVTPA